MQVFIAGIRGFFFGQGSVAQLLLIMIYCGLIRQRYDEPSKFLLKKHNLTQYKQNEESL